MQDLDRFGHVRPEPGARARCEAGPLTHGGHVLAWEAAAQHIDRGYVAPGDGGDVAQVRGVGPVVGEDAGDVFVVLGEPDRLGIQGVFDGEVEPSVPGEQRSNPERASPVVRVMHEGSG